MARSLRRRAGRFGLYEFLSVRVRKLEVWRAANAESQLPPARRVTKEVMMMTCPPALSQFL